MNNVIERLYDAIALEIFEIRPDGGWSEGTHRVACITNFMEGTCTFIMEDGSQQGKETSFRSAQLFFELREEMAKLNNNGHAWYSASCTLSDVGKFKFYFDYDHLPPLDIIPDPERWVLEFKQHPRPDLQMQVQDWIDGKVAPEVIVERLRKLQGTVKA